MCYDQGRQTNNFSHASNQLQNIMGVCMSFSLPITVWSFGNKKLSLPPHAIGRNLWCKAPQFSSVWYVDSFWSKIPRLGQQDTSIKISDISNEIFLNKRPEEKLLRYGTQTSPTRHCGKGFEHKVSSLLRQATRMASHIRHPDCISTTLRTIVRYYTVSWQYMTAQLKNQNRIIFVRSTNQSRHMPTARIECLMVYSSYIWWACIPGHTSHWYKIRQWSSRYT